ncbi:uncharacterized protein LOC120481362 [Pimephales promelas]|uniref:uncharacterized protein LOC120481362 n=1 Tax=Pimephales promelas TaxID=90988 RepID=UPI001955B25C|nr:uncharacterized protein LOC120481362 [Pimephales promelas]
MDPTASKICQMYGEGQHREKDVIYKYNPYFKYATLYSTHHRIPLYSAYRFNPECGNDSRRKDDWHVEPQLSGYPTRYMVRETDLRNLALDEDVIKRSQAVSSDYSFSGYDRGHLKPSSFDCGDGRKATFTLTNAAPMDPDFNRVHWEQWERNLKSFLLNQRKSDEGLATVYIVTGTVPNANLRIPQRGNPEELSGYEEFSGSEELSEDYERVSVPSHVWTAVCYKHHSDDSKSFSFGYMGENQPEEPDINLMRVSDLNDQLSRLYRELSGTPQTVNIFVDGCFEDDDDDDEINKVKNEFKKLTNLPGRQGLHMSTDVQTTFSAVKRAICSESQSSEKKVKVKEMTVKLLFDSMKTYYTMAEDLKVSAGSACLITNTKPVVFGQLDLRKRDVSEWPDAVECLLVPEKQKTAADGSKCSSVSESRDSCWCTSGGQTKPCCSSPCLYVHHLEDYRCSSGQTQIKCSPRYSLVTVNRERCKDDHPCGTYGYNYYWCYKASGSWDYCSPPVWSSKAKSGKFCRSDHACAKYGKSYLWCYTDNRNNWDYCCKNCA